jgi:hypothetical protein
MKMTYAVRIDESTTQTRTSVKPYTHAVLVREIKDGRRGVVAWASSRELAEKAMKNYTRRPDIWDIVRVVEVEPLV